MPIWLPPPPPAIVWMQVPQGKRSLEGAAFACDDTGIIRCSAVETVTANRSAEDIRVIAKYIALLSERNRRYYLSWRERLPSAAYEVVRRIRPFPYLPNGDMYAITDMQLILQEDQDRILVRYPRRPSAPSISELPEDDWVIYETTLSAFMKVVQKETARLRKYAR